MFLTHFDCLSLEPMVGNNKTRASRGAYLAVNLRGRPDLGASSGIKSFPGTALDIYLFLTLRTKNSVHPALLATSQLDKGLPSCSFKMLITLSLRATLAFMGALGGFM